MQGSQCCAPRPPSLDAPCTLTAAISKHPFSLRAPSEEACPRGHQGDRKEWGREVTLCQGPSAWSFLLSHHAPFPAQTRFMPRQHHWHRIRPAGLMASPC